jgi:hypothetical protein
MAGGTAAISCNRVSKLVKLQNRASKSPRLGVRVKKPRPLRHPDSFFVYCASKVVALWFRRANRLCQIPSRFTR